MFKFNEEKTLREKDENLHISLYNSLMCTTRYKQELPRAEDGVNEHLVG